MSLTVAIAQINSAVGDIDGNRQRIAAFSRRAAAAGADVVITPELSLTGCPPKDLLLDTGFYEATTRALSSLAADLSDLPGLHVLAGHHLMIGNERYNACSVLSEGRIVDTCCKTILSDRPASDGKHYFSPGKRPVVFTVKGIGFGISIGEDAWLADNPALAKKNGAGILLVPDAAVYNADSFLTRYDDLVKNTSAQGMAVICANLVGGQDDLVFDGNSLALDHEGKLCARLKHCAEDVELIRFDNGGKMLSGRREKSLPSEEAIYRALVLGTRDYVEKNAFPGVILGLSGGVDSALTLAIAVDALGKEKVRAVMMPSRYTSTISITDAGEMASRLGIRYDTIPIDACFSVFCNTLSQQFSGLPEDATEENIQARIRGTLLMALSNKTGAIVLTTGNKSELAVGYSTLYGDMAGGLAVICDIPKTLVYRLCHYRNGLSDVIPSRILTRAPSAELRPDQLDQDSLPPYDILDAVIRMFMEEGKSLAEITEAGYDRETVKRILFLIRRNEHKRRQMPVGIRITPRGAGYDRKYPVTSGYRDN